MKGGQGHGCWILRGDVHEKQTLIIISNIFQGSVSELPHTKLEIAVAQGGGVTLGQASSFQELP